MEACQNTDGLCHSERSEESVNISRKYKAHVIRFFATLRMTRDRLEITIKERICIFNTPSTGIVKSIK